MIPKMNKGIILVFGILLMLLSLFSASAQEYEVDKFTTALWHMNEGSGNTIFDETGGNDGTIDGATWIEGKYGSALSFDGVDDHVFVDNSPK